MAHTVESWSLRRVDDFARQTCKNPAAEAFSKLQGLKLRRAHDRQASKAGRLTFWKKARCRIGGLVSTHKYARIVIHVIWLEVPGCNEVQECSRMNTSHIICIQMNTCLLVSEQKILKAWKDFQKKKCHVDISSARNPRLETRPSLRKFR